MDSLLEKRHAQMAPENQLENLAGIALYLLHSVTNPNKPEKIRVVVDCAARYSGVSLNSQLVQGPDLTNNLVVVVTRFREEPIAVMADMECSAALFGTSDRTIYKCHREGFNLQRI